LDRVKSTKLTRIMGRTRVSLGAIFSITVSLTTGLDRPGRPAMTILTAQHGTEARMTMEAAE
jgi:hypothetical protein